LSPSDYVLGVAALVGAGVLAVALRVALRAYLRYRGTRVIVCPEQVEFAAVEVDAVTAALTAPYGKSDLRLESCSRWPERGDCGEACLAQIEAAPEACLLRTILTDWYQGKSCALCGKPFGEIRWMDHEPALLGSEGVTVEWRETAPELVVSVLASHRPVCWNCHVAETFRRQHPDLVTDRAPHGHS
jgi:hypothetical protein